MDLDRSHPFSEHIQAIEAYIKSAATLTRQLLGLARGGKYEVKPVDLAAVVRNSAAMFGRTRKEIVIHTEMGQPPPVVECDMRQIEQVLLNMYLNAWQAMPAGGDLHLETRTVTLDETFCIPHGMAPGPYAKVSVTDTGCGMDEATRQRVFDPFFTTKEMSRGDRAGIGVGLWHREESRRAYHRLQPGWKGRYV